MSDVEKISPTVNRAELAHTFGISLPTVDAWVRRGCPCVAAGSKGRESQFRLADVTQWRIDCAVADVVSIFKTAGEKILAQLAAANAVLAT